MKRILVLVDRAGVKKETFTRLITERLGSEIELVLALFSDLTFDIGDAGVSVKINTEDIRNFQLVYFRRAGNIFFSIAGALAICLDRFKIPFFDTTFKEVGPDEDKLVNLIRLKLAGLPIIPTFFCWPTQIGRYCDQIISRFGLPLVAKTLDSHRGRGVHLLGAKEDFGKITAGNKKQFLFQSFVENDFEYRILVLKDKVAVAERKIRTDPNEFRSNVALGAREEFLKVADFPEEIKQAAILAARTLKIETAGVDVLIEKKNGKFWILEVNRGPGLTYDTTVSPEIDEIAKFFKQELDKNV